MLCPILVMHLALSAYVKVRLVAHYTDVSEGIQLPWIFRQQI